MNNKKYSKKFIETIIFFNKIYRNKTLTFCGDYININYSKDGMNGLDAFNLYESGEKIHNIKTKHPNILYSLIFGKKSWGIYVNMCKDAFFDDLYINEKIVHNKKEFIIDKMPLFNINECLDIFINTNVFIPSKFLNELTNYRDTLNTMKGYTLEYAKKYIFIKKKLISTGVLLNDTIVYNIYNFYNIK